LERGAVRASLAAMELKTVTDDSFTAEVLESETPVLVDFWAAWCGPCRVMNPILAELAAERDDVRIVKLDTEAEQETAARYGVLAMPTFLLFRDGKPVLQLVGSRPRKRLEAELSAALAA
jgi:thioredoxin 1